MKNFNQSQVQRKERKNSTKNVKHLETFAPHDDYKISIPEGRFAKFSKIRKIMMMTTKQSLIAKALYVLSGSRRPIDRWVGGRDDSALIQHVLDHNAELLDAIMDIIGLFQPGGQSSISRNEDRDPADNVII